MPISGQSLPTFSTDTTAVVTPSRADNYGGAIVLPTSGKEIGAVAEGSYFTAITPTPGTGVIGHAAPTTFDETKAYIYIYNASSTVCIYPQFLQLHETVASAGGTGLQFTITLDATNRYSSTGSNLTVSNCNSRSSVATVATTAKIGNVVLTAATGARRILGNVVLRPMTQIDIVEDFYELVFAGQGQGTNMSVTSPATLSTISRTVFPVCIGPGWGMAIHEWRGSQSTGPTFEAIFGWIER